MGSDPYHFHRVSALLVPNRCNVISLYLLLMAWKPNDYLEWMKLVFKKNNMWIENCRDDITHHSLMRVKYTDIVLHFQWWHMTRGIVWLVPSTFYFKLDGLFSLYPYSTILAQSQPSIGLIIKCICHLVYRVQYCPFSLYLFHM